jgi:hypothetical protein
LICGQTGTIRSDWRGKKYYDKSKNYLFQLFPLMRVRLR